MKEEKKKEEKENQASFTLSLIYDNQEKEAEIKKVIRSKLRNFPAAPTVTLHELFSAQPEVAKIAKTSNVATKSNSDLKSVLIGKYYIHKPNYKPRIDYAHHDFILYMLILFFIFVVVIVLILNDINIDYSGSVPDRGGRPGERREASMPSFKARETEHPQVSSYLYLFRPLSLLHRKIESKRRKRKEKKEEEKEERKLNLS